MGLMSAMEQNFNPSMADVNRKTRQGTRFLSVVVCVLHTHTQLKVVLSIVIPLFSSLFLFPILQVTPSG